MSDDSVVEEPIAIAPELLRALFDLATSSMDFGSGFLVDEDVEALRTVAGLLGVDPMVGTPPNFVCKFTGEHRWSPYGSHQRRCYKCGTVRDGVVETDRPSPYTTGL